MRTTFYFVQFGETRLADLSLSNRRVEWISKISLHKIAKFKSFCLSSSYGTKLVGGVKLCYSICNR
jgi:hypothetical protein